MNWYTILVFVYRFKRPIRISNLDCNNFGPTSYQRLLGVASFESPSDFTSGILSHDRSKTNAQNANRAARKQRILLPLLLSLFAYKLLHFSCLSPVIGLHCKLH